MGHSRSDELQGIVFHFEKRNLVGGERRAALPSSLTDADSVVWARSAELYKVWTTKYNTALDVYKRQVMSDILMFINDDVIL